MDQLLYPITYGTLAYCGFEVVEPRVCFGINESSQEERKKCLRDLGEYVMGIETKKQMI